MSPAKPTPGKHEELISADGWRRGFLCSKNHILIDGSDFDKTIKDVQILKPDVKIIEPVRDLGRSPILGMKQSDYEERLYAIRRTLCQVNRTMRFPNDYEDLGKVAR